MSALDPPCPRGKVVSHSTPRTCVNPDAAIIEVEYFPDPVWQDECVIFVFARNEGPPEFVGAYFDFLRDDEIGYRVRVPCALDQLSSDALSTALSFALSVCNRLDDEPPTLRDPVGAS